eukprot:359990-Chlamydomonas_euryale.AAC.5
MQRLTSCTCAGALHMRCRGRPLGAEADHLAKHVAAAARARGAHTEGGRQNSQTCRARKGRPPTATVSRHAPKTGSGPPATLRPGRRASWLRRGQRHISSACCMCVAQCCTHDDGRAGSHAHAGMPQCPATCTSARLPTCTHLRWGLPVRMQ